MMTDNTTLLEILPLLLNLFAVHMIIRMVFGLLFLMVLILPRFLRNQVAWIPPLAFDRTSSEYATDINFNEKITHYPKPFLLDQVY